MKIRHVLAILLIGWLLISGGCRIVLSWVKTEAAKVESIRDFEQKGGLGL